MFILVPLTLLLASAVGILVVVFRKMPYLNKLTPETHAGGDILTDLFPELSAGFKGLKLKEYGDLWLVELEKLLRRLRVISLKMDRISDSWIKKIRKGNISRTINSSIEKKTETIEIPVSKAQSVQVITMKDMKREEQRLIIEIAKNPKDSKLYEVLGDLYIKTNNFSDAKESFEAAIELSPNNEELQKKLSQVLEKMVNSQ
ncbi:MAG: tetratricopeptide repeat protein [Patescibacteria group bacterium]